MLGESTTGECKVGMNTFSCPLESLEEALEDVIGASVPQIKSILKL